MQNSDIDINELKHKIKNGKIQGNMTCIARCLHPEFKENYQNSQSIDLSSETILDTLTTIQNYQ